MQQVVWDLLASRNGLRIAVRLRVAEPAPSRNDRAVANAEAQSGGGSLNERRCEPLADEHKIQRRSVGTQYRAGRRAADVDAHRLTMRLARDQVRTENRVQYLDEIGSGHAVDERRGA